MSAMRQGVTASQGVAWAIPGLFATSIVVQRFSLPGGTVPLLLPVVLGWCLLGLWQGWLETDRRRVWLLLLAGTATAVAALAQAVVVPGARVSLFSWGLLLAIWAPAALRLVNRHQHEVMVAFRACVRVGIVLAVACIAMMAIQLLGWSYTDPLAAVVPSSFLIDGYVITYPLSYGSALYRANALIGLEPSIVSLQLGVALVLAILVRARSWAVVVLLAGIACTASGSGLFVVAVALVVMALHPMRRWLVRALGPMAAVLLVIALTPLGQGLLARVAESSVAGSSTNLRALQPYAVAWPQWTSDLAGLVLGWGAGSSQALMSATRISGLLVPSPLKVLFDYGLVAGVVLALFLLACYLGGPSRSLAVALVASSWLLQPGTTTLVLALPTLLFVTWWAPRSGSPLECDVAAPVVSERTLVSA